MTTEQFRQALADRGYPASPSAVRKWLAAGLVPGAICHGGRIWDIPEAAAYSWRPPQGRPNRAPGTSLRSEYRRRAKSRQRQA